MDAEGYGALFDEDDRQDFFDRALMPFRDRQGVEGGGPHQRLADFLGVSRSWVRDNVKGNARTVPLEKLDSMLDIVLFSEPVYMAPDMDIYVDEIIEDHVTGEPRAVIDPAIQKRVLGYFPLSELEESTGANYDTLRDYRAGKKKSLPLDFWESVKQISRLDDLSMIEVDLVDYSGFRHGVDLETSTVHENVALRKIPHLLTNDIDDEILSIPAGAVPYYSPFEGFSYIKSFLDSAEKFRDEDARHASQVEGNYEELLSGIIDALERGNSYIGIHSYENLSNNLGGKGLKVFDNYFGIVESFSKRNYRIEIDLDEARKLEYAAAYLDHRDSRSSTVTKMAEVAE